jgi:hypothetical protein
MNRSLSYEISRHFADNSTWFVATLQVIRSAGLTVNPGLASERCRYQEDSDVRRSVEMEPCPPTAEPPPKDNSLLVAQVFLRRQPIDEIERAFVRRLFIRSGSGSDLSLFDQPPNRPILWSNPPAFASVIWGGNL